MSYTSEAKRDDGSAVTVEWEVLEHGEPDFDSPGHICDGGGSGPVISIINSYDVDDGHIELTDKERERIEEELAASYEPDYSDSWED